MSHGQLLALFLLKHNDFALREDPRRRLKSSTLPVFCSNSLDYVMCVLAKA
jgi:hypothetical protein